MSFRNRPTLDRRHRPRWQDERRTQQIVLGAFALAIAVALGIFAATAWNDYYGQHLRQVALVGGTSFDRDDLAERELILRTDLAAEAEALLAAGDPNDPLLQQQLESLSLRGSQLTGEASASLVDGAFLAERAGEFGISVSEAEIDAEIERRATTPERVAFSVITVNALPEDAAPGDEPDEADFARAEEEAAALRARLDEGEEFAAVVAESDDPSAASGGSIGAVTADDERWGELAAAAAGVGEGELVGPLATEDGYVIARVDGRQPATVDEGHVERFTDRGISEETFRAYLRDELLAVKFREHFASHVAGAAQEQRRVAQIFVAGSPAATESGEPAPERRVRHVLVQPLPDEPDQAAATSEDWEAAFDRARSLQEQLAAEDADWVAIAAEESGDPGSAGRGGDLGWVDPLTSGFVEPFAAAVVALEVGELSDPVRTDFGYHLIEVTAERESVAELVERLTAELADDPDAFAELARRLSDDAASAEEGGEIGWVARYQLPAELEAAIFGIEEEGAISEPIEVPNEGTYLFRLLEVEERVTEEERLADVVATGYPRWLDELRRDAPIWVDPEFQAAQAGS